MNEYYKIKIDKKYWNSKSGCCINNKDVATKFCTLSDVVFAVRDLRNNIYSNSEIKIIKITESEVIIDF